jgi:FHS family L-fucose permease-like MFS transporter
LILGRLKDVKAEELVGPALDAYRMAETQTVVNTYTALAAALALVAAVVWFNRNRLKGEKHEKTSLASGFALSEKRFGLGALCIFLYVGAEVSIGSLIVNYLKQPSVMGLDDAAAGNYIPITGQARWWAVLSVRPCCAWCRRAKCWPLTRLARLR